MIHPWRALRAQPHITVRFLELPAGLLGFCDHPSQTIYLASGMVQRQRRSVLHHEMVHLSRGEVGECPTLIAREESDVERIASTDLIPLDDLVTALAWSFDVDEVARELWTDVATVRDRLRHLTATERAYVEAQIDARGIA